MGQKRLERASKKYSTQGHQEEGQKYEPKKRASRLICMVREKKVGALQPLPLVLGCVEALQCQVKVQGDDAPLDSSAALAAP